jgi:hypothetical protein
MNGYHFSQPLRVKVSAFTDVLLMMIFSSIPQNCELHGALSKRLFGLRVWPFHLRPFLSNAQV